MLSFNASLLARELTEPGMGMQRRHAGELLNDAFNAVIPQIYDHSTTSCRAASMDAIYGCPARPRSSACATTRSGVAHHQRRHDLHRARPRRRRLLVVSASFARRAANQVSLRKAPA